MKTRGLPPVVRLAISVCLLLLLFSVGGVEIQAVLASLAGARPMPLAGAALCYALLGSIARGYRWRALIRALGHQISARRSTELFLVGTFFNQFLPTGFGGDAVRTLMLGSEGLGAARAATTVVVDRALGILLLLGVGLLALVVAWGRVAPTVAVPLLLASAAGAAGSIVLVSGRRWRMRMAGLPMLGRLVGLPSVARFVDAFAEFAPPSLAVATAWSAVFTGLLVGSNVLVGRALGIHQAALRDWLLVVPLVSLSGLLPSVGGWGVREWTYAGLLATLDPPVDLSVATAMSVQFGVMNLAVAAAGWVAWTVGGSRARQD